MGLEARIVTGGNSRTQSVRNGLLSLEKDKIDHVYIHDAARPFVDKALLTLKGHSDADAGLHALTDAILGALAFGDIGDHFPPSDPKWKGARSDKFLIFAIEKIKERAGTLQHIDVTLICEKPKIKPHREAMRQKISELCGLPLSRVSVKATTTEKLGFTGRGEGLAAQATATIVLPSE